MTLVDTSAWVEFLRATGSDTHLAVRNLLEGDARVHTTDVVMEVRRGTRQDHLDRLRRLLPGCDHVPVERLGDFEQAAALYRACRRAGTTVRGLTDCLIAAVASRADLLVLHADQDFEVLARHRGVGADTAPS